ncbi:rhomboid family intramembrane serine protease [Desulfuromonas thiophila]|uniref:Membrane associated serine protease, rhomboid family n=1 Tax=Desulfuromonas thiophila TaxID=57664 RepID=A0A1G6XY83_9BACT|nr:rhomboid family intramembrane serine protease [Desulfuromonas thiophila]SDD83174.1 Membrane associated serine protease, rhomboid family [Desulfuromonas thiophila]
MFLPLGDSPNPPGRAWVNTGLIALNVAVYLLVSLPLAHSAPDLTSPWLHEYLHALGVRTPAQLQLVLSHLSAYEALVYQYGFKPADPSLLTLLTSLFLHGGLLHLAGNMLFLWIFGDNVEYRLGALRYLLVYLLCGVAATLFFALFTPASRIPLVGASGAISGVLGCYFLWFRRNRVKTFVFLFPFFMQSLFLPARLVLGFYLVVDNLLPFLFAGSSAGGVAHGAHIGGFIAGLAIAAATDRLPGLARRQHYRHEARQTAQQQDSAAPADPAALLALLQQQRFDKAAALYFRLSRQQRQGLPAAALLALAGFLHQQRDADACLSLLRRFIAERPSDALLPQAFMLAGQTLLLKKNCDFSAYQYYLAAADLARDPLLAEQARQALRLLEQRCRRGTV